ncbi:MAG: hypothetical protein A4E71_00507 [Smithella sp. PtaU1.Bin162]|nr:MAG: hypothetical protein A4E71_00507 [Smithella sp. PtaU1.Bin162]
MNKIRLQPAIENPGRWPRLLATTYAVTGATLLSLSLACSLITPQVLLETFLPLLTRLFSPDAKIEPKTVVLLANAAGALLPIATGIGLFCLVFGTSGRLILRRSNPDSQQVSPLPPASRELFWGLLICIIGIIIRWPLMLRGLSYDELFSVTHHLKPIQDFFSHFPVTTNNHLLYNLLGYYSRDFFGPAEWTFRLPAFIFGIGTITAVWLASRPLLSPRTTLWAALLLSISPAHVIWSTTGRAYSGYVLCSTLFILFYFQTLERPAAGKRDLLAVTAILGGLFHLFFLFFPIAAMIHLSILSLLNRRTPERLPPGAAAAWTACGIGLALAGITLSFLNLRPLIEMSGQTPPPASGSFLLQLWSSLLALPHWAAALPIFLLIIVGGLRFRTHPQRPDILFILLILMPVAIWLTRPYFLYERFWAGLLPFILLGISAGTERVLGLRHGRILSAATLMAISAAMLSTWSNGTSALINEYSQPFREATRLAEKRSGDSPFLCSIEPTAHLFRYYSSRPVIKIEKTADAGLLLDRAPNAACLAIPHFISPTATESYELLHDFRTRCREERLGIISVFSGCQKRK